MIYTWRSGATQIPEDAVLQYFTDMISTSGVLDLGASNHFQVQAQTVPDMTIKVIKGRAYIKGASTNVYPVLMDADTNVAISANSSGNNRSDAIALYIDKSASPSADSTGVAKLIAIQGTPAGSPTAPTDNDIQTAVGAANPFIRLANVQVNNGTTSIVSGNITDSRSKFTVSSNFVPTSNPPQGYLINGKFSITVASNNITVALKTLAGNNPSSADPVYARIGDTLRTITSALSVTKNAGTNWFNAGSAELATKEIDYFIYLGYNATDGVTIGFARIPWANKYSDFSATSTNDNYCAISTITNAAATDNYENMGRFAATLGASASYNWSVPTYTPTNLIQRPIFETRFLAWAPAYTGFTGAVSTYGANYRIIGKKCQVYISGNGTSNAAGFTFTLPITGANYSAIGSLDIIVAVVDNGTWQNSPGIICNPQGSTTANVGKTISSQSGGTYAGFTSSGGKGINSQFSYDITNS